MHDVFPELRAARIDYCWGGMVDMTRDRLPRAGERNGIYYSMGYSGHGTQMSTLMGTIMAEVMDGRAELNPWKNFAWPAIPGHFGRPWFLPLVGAYYGSRTSSPEAFCHLVDEETATNEHKNLTA